MIMPETTDIFTFCHPLFIRKFENLTCLYVTLQINLMTVYLNAKKPKFLLLIAIEWFNRDSPFPRK